MFQIFLEFWNEILVFNTKSFKFLLGWVRWLFEIIFQVMMERRKCSVFFFLLLWVKKPIVFISWILKSDQQTCEVLSTKWHSLVLNLYGCSLPIWCENLPLDFDTTSGIWCRELINCYWFRTEFHIILP